METQIVEILESVLYDEEQQLLKDVINYGRCVDGDYEFLIGGEIRTEHMMGYCTNAAKLAGHFEGRRTGGIFRSIYSKLGLKKDIGEYISHASDWEGDGSGDMLFVRYDVCEEIEEWAKE